MESLFKNDNLQMEKDENDKIKDGIIEELNELYTSGLCKPGYYKAKLGETSKN